MTKKEQARFEAALTASALRSTSPVPRDLAPPLNSYERSGPSLTHGWDFNTYRGTTEKACSSSIYHGFGWDHVSSQQPRSLFSTRLLALKAMRYEIEQESAKRLRAVDRMIEEEIANPTPNYKEPENVSE
jgi:hypothetical protein